MPSHAGLPRSHRTNVPASWASALRRWRADGRCSRKATSRVCSCIQLESDPGWFLGTTRCSRSVLRRRLERDRLTGLGRFPAAGPGVRLEHGYSTRPRPRVAAGNPELAVQLSKEDETRPARAQSKMTTLLGILRQLPPRVVASRPHACSEQTCLGAEYPFAALGLPAHAASESVRRRRWTARRCSPPPTRARGRADLRAEAEKWCAALPRY